MTKHSLLYVRKPCIGFSRFIPRIDLLHLRILWENRNAAPKPSGFYLKNCNWHQLFYATYLYITLLQLFVQKIDTRSPLPYSVYLAWNSVCNIFEEHSNNVETITFPWGINGFFSLSLCLQSINFVVKIEITHNVKFHSSRRTFFCFLRISSQHKITPVWSHPSVISNR